MDKNPSILENIPKEMVEYYHRPPYLNLCFYSIKNINKKMFFNGDEEDGVYVSGYIWSNALPKRNIECINYLKRIWYDIYQI